MSCQWCLCCFTVFKRFKYSLLIVKASSGAQFAVILDVPVTEFCRHLVDMYIHRWAKPYSVLNKGLSCFFRTSFCPMTNEDQHVLESQLKVFVRCQEDTPKQRRRKHSRLNAQWQNFNKKPSWAVDRAQCELLKYF